MSLLFHGPHGSVEQRWIVYALLRDNVQHHLEKGRRSPRFASTYAVAQALGGKPVDIDARQLRDELIAEKELLCARPIKDLAIGARTRAVIELTFPFPEGDQTVLASECGMSLPVAASARTLGDVFGHLIDDLLRIASAAGEAGRIEVLDL